MFNKTSFSNNKEIQIASALKEVNSIAENNRGAVAMAGSARVHARALLRFPDYTPDYEEVHFYQ